MTVDFKALIQVVARGGPDGARAFDEFVAHGQDAVPAVVEGLAAGRAVLYWEAALTALEVPDKVVVLADHLTHPELTVRMAMIRALGCSGDPAAVAPLVARLDPERPLAALVASALGDLGLVGGDRAVAALREAAAAVVGLPFDAERLTGLRQRATSNGSGPKPELVISLAEALAKCGDMTLRPAVIELAAFDPADPVPADVREAAVQSLEVMIGPGVAAALHRACRDPDDEVAASALAATLLLGRLPEMELWLSMLAEADYDDDDEFDFRTCVLLACLDTMSGERAFRELPSDAESARWRAGIESRLDRGVCYRAGQPATPALLLTRVAGEDSLLWCSYLSARRELRLLTGQPWMDNPMGSFTPGEVAAVTVWWEQNSQRFAAGQLHRWGRSYDPGAVD